MTRRYCDVCKTEMPMCATPGRTTSHEITLGGETSNYPTIVELRVAGTDMFSESGGEIDTDYCAHCTKRAVLLAIGLPEKLAGEK